MTRKTAKKGSKGLTCFKYFAHKKKKIVTTYVSTLGSDGLSEEVRREEDIELPQYGGEVGGALKKGEEQGAEVGVS